MKAALTALLLAAAPAAAQHTVHWLWSVTTDDADPLVEPGETATVSLALDLFPSVGEEGVSGQEISGFGFCNVELLGDANAYTGQVTGWEYNPDLIALTGDLAETDGVSIFNISLGQGIGDSPFSGADPLFAFQFTWEPDDYDDYTVGYLTNTENMWVWEGGHGWEGETYEWAWSEAAITFDVVGGCDADVNGDGALDILDFVAFQLLWQQQDPQADCDANARFDVIDFVCFQQLFVQGCD